MNRRLFEALTKVAGDPREFLDRHFGDSPDWKTFQQNLRSKNFVSAVEEDPRSDSKLKRFAKNVSRHKQARGVPSFSVPSQTGSQLYTVKYHPDVDRFSCNCGDWIYARSHRKGQKTRDCKHVHMVQLEVRAQGALAHKMIKEAFVRLSFLLRC